MVKTKARVILKCSNLSSAEGKRCICDIFVDAVDDIRLEGGHDVMQYRRRERDEVSPYSNCDVSWFNFEISIILSYVARRTEGTVSAYPFDASK